MTERRRKHWGWGFEDQQPDRAALKAALPKIRERLGFGAGSVEEPVALEDIELPRPRISVPSLLSDYLTDDHYERVSHALGKAYRDVVRGMRGQFDAAPDLVARPRDESEVEIVLGWCADEGYAAIPYGGGTSVVGGVEPRGLDDYPGVVTVDLGALDRVLEVDEASHAARIQAGVLGPALEDQLKSHGMTLRHFPQSFEYSSLGGWIVTRAGGHFATLYTHIDDLVESVRAITPSGAWESFRLPGSGAGPSPDRMLIGSEGTLGIVTEAWVRIRPRPEWKLSCGVTFDSFREGAAAVRALAQSGLNPSNCRLLDPVEAETTSAGPAGKALLVLGFESAFGPVDAAMDAAVECARDYGGDPGEVKGRRGADASAETSAGTPQPGASGLGGGSSDGASDAVGAWRHAFLAAPYLRDTMVGCGVLSDTFETAITWDRFEAFHDAVMAGAREAVAAECDAPADGEGAPRISCRFTHVYPDGPAPYYTILAPARRGEEVAQWDAIKAAAGDVINREGGTITHHHAVGRDHRPWYDRQRPDPFAAALRGAKAAVDPAGILNPGVLIDT